MFLQNQSEIGNLPNRPLTCWEEKEEFKKVVQEEPCLGVLRTKPTRLGFKPH